MSTPARLVSSIALALAPFEEVRVVYLFGSRARETASPDSDLDVAIVLPRTLDTAGRERVRRDVLVALDEADETAGLPVDVVDLRRTDSAVAFRAIREGVLVLARTPEERVATEVYVGRRYDDDARDPGAGGNKAAKGPQVSALMPALSDGRGVHVEAAQSRQPLPGFRATHAA